MATKTPKSAKFPVAQNPLILRCQRLMEAFAKSDDERDFYLDRVEGFLVYVDLDHATDELDILYQELETDNERYCLIPKLTFFETKKIMEGFVNEKVYDIDTKEKLLDIIQSKEAREHFLEFIYDHHTELEKWQQYYQERSRIRIIEWLRKNEFYFVFEEDLDFTKQTMENVKRSLFEKEASRDVQGARKALVTKAKTYYSNEALNPRPKRGRPPKQAAKLEVEPQVSVDIYTQVPAPIRPFLFIPEISSTSAATFSSKFDNEAELIASRRITQDPDRDLTLESLNKKLATLRELSSKLMEKGVNPNVPAARPESKLFSEEDDLLDFDADDDEDVEDFDSDDDDDLPPKRSVSRRKPAPATSKAKKPAIPPAKKTPPPKAPVVGKTPPPKKPTPPPPKKAVETPEPAQKVPAKTEAIKKAPPKRIIPTKLAPKKPASTKTATAVKPSGVKKSSSKPVAKNKRTDARR